MSRASSGAKAANHGRQFEESVYHFSMVLINQGRLDMFVHNQPLMKPIYVSVGNQQRTAFIPTTQGGADFVAIAGGYQPSVYVFDTKSTSHNNSLTIPKASQHQLDELIRLWNLGHTTFLLIDWRNSNEIRIHTPNTFSGRTINRRLGHVVQSFDWLTEADYIRP